MGSSKRDRGGEGQLQCLKWKQEDTELVSLFGKGKEGKPGGSLKVRRDTGEQTRDAEDSS